MTVNIGPAGVARRRRGGLILLAGGVAAAVAVAALGFSPGLCLLLWAPYWWAALLLIQARERT